MRIYISSAVLSLVVISRAADPTVVISAGTIIGTATRVQNQPSVTGLVNAYLGVPFAEKPVRFAAPEPATTFSAPFSANTLPPVCLQSYTDDASGQLNKYYFNNPVEYGDLRESEDCLYLNIYAPQGACPSTPKAVLFWLFGGNLNAGGSSLVIYNGSSLAVNQDVVVVVPNYRTNIFGFPSSPQLGPGLKNPGFLDQRMALQWVQDNIAEFGGDPTKVTLFGQSAGGFSIKQLLAQPPSPLPFHAAILESEGQTMGDGTSAYQSVALHFGCALAASPIECLRSPNISGVDIQDYIQSQTLLPLFFPPQPDTNNMNDNTRPSIDSGEFAAVPILLGNNKDEATLFLEIMGITPTQPGLDLNQTLSAALGFDASNFTVPLTQLYSAVVGNSTYNILTRVLTDYIYTCPNNILSEYVASKKRQLVWRYRYDPNFPDLLYNKTYLSSYHTSEIPSVFGTYPLSNRFGSATPTQAALSSYMQGVWANFAKNPSAGPSWPALQSTADGVELGLLGADGNRTGETTVAKATADYPCLLLNPIIEAQMVGY